LRNNLGSVVVGQFKALSHERPAAPLVLRPYQIADLARVGARFAAGARRVCYQAPTGSGKNHFVPTCSRWRGGAWQSPAFLGHRDEIVQQISEALDMLGVAHALVVAGHESSFSC